MLTAFVNTLNFVMPYILGEGLDTKIGLKMYISSS